MAMFGARANSKFNAGFPQVGERRGGGGIAQDRPRPQRTGQNWFVGLLLAFGSVRNIIIGASVRGWDTGGRVVVASTHTVHTERRRGDPNCFP